MHSQFQFNVLEVDKNEKVTAVLAGADNLLVARAAYFEAVKHRPGRGVMLVHRARIIEQMLLGEIQKDETSLD